MVQWKNYTKNKAPYKRGKFCFTLADYCSEITFAKERKSDSVCK